MDTSNLTTEQKAKLRAEFAAEDAVAAEKKLHDREAYKMLADEFIKRNIARLQILSSEMMRIKQEIFADVETLIEMKNNLFKVKIDRLSDTFTTSDGKMSLTLGSRSNEGWDDTVNAGIAKVKEFLGTLARDENSAMLVDTVMSLMAKDRKGNLKASKVLELEKMAIKSQDSIFLDGIAIIKAAYRPSPSCQFIEVSIKDEKGNDIKLPLSMAAMK